jgi:hypothetical protein
MSDPENAERCRQLVRQLHEPWSRRAARRELMDAGAVAPLLECLRSTNESVVWAAVESLGGMRATEAVGPLVDLLERGALTLDVCEALTMITGQDFGADVKCWRDWLARPDADKPSRLDLAECVARAGRYLGVEPTGSKQSYRFKLPLPGDRTQKVAVYFGREDEQGGELVVIYSECGPANPKHYEAVLRKNLAIPAGAFAIRDINGKPNFVIVDTMVAGSVTPRALARKIEHIASQADTIEKVLTQEDRR